MKIGERREALYKKLSLSAFFSVKNKTLYTRSVKVSHFTICFVKRKVFHKTKDFSFELLK